MLALLAAATVAATAPVTPTIPRTERTPNLYRVPEGCRNAPYHVVDRFGRPLAERLGDLPAAGPMLLVDRRVNGCPVITMMRGGPPPVDQPNPPPSQYKVLPLRPGAR